MIAGRIARELRRWRRAELDRLPPRRRRIRLGRDPIELHMLVCDRDVNMSLWSLQSFVAFSGLLPRVVVHSDGTLGDEHRRRYERYFDSVSLFEDPDASARMDEALAPWPTCRRMRRRADFFCARKLFDPLFLTRSDTLLVLDSDVLFFRRPDGLLDHIARGRPCFSSDYQNAYSLSHAEVERWRGGHVLECVNAGVLHIPVAGYREHLDLVEDFLAYAEREILEGDVNRHEQTAHALLMSALDATRLPPAYQIDGRLGARTVSYHFVGDGKGRKDFWRMGVPRLERRLLSLLERVPAA